MQIGERFLAHRVGYYLKQAVSGPAGWLDVGEAFRSFACTSEMRNSAMRLSASPDVVLGVYADHYRWSKCR